MDGKLLLAKYNDLGDMIKKAGPDLDKFVNRGNKSARIRFRKAMLDLRNLAQECRDESTKLQRQRNERLVRKSTP